MQAASKVIVNTVILYIKIVLSLLIALISVPLVLNALGASDYGLYNLVAGIVAMLAFLNNSLTVSTQRYMSIAMGENDREKINIIYNTSFLLHLFLGFIVILVFEIGGLVFIDEFNIEANRLWSAKVIFQFLIMSTFFKIIAVPFDALVNAREDMLPFSIIELIDSLLMLLSAFSIGYFAGNKLVFYGICILLISFLSILLKYSWCKYAYRDFSISLKNFKGRFKIKEVIGFTGWNLYAGLAMMGRNQGVAIVINLFLGTIANAAYGIANQINGALNHFSATFQKAINPQLMKSEGMKDRNRMLKISYISSKFSVLAIALFAIPLIMEMDEVLSLWLKDNIPPYTLRLSQLILILSIFYQYSVGIMSAVQATGKIRNYQITIGSLLLLNVPIAYIVLKLGYPVYYTIVGFIILEIISLIVRLALAHKLAGMSVIMYITQVVRPTAIIILIPTVVSCIPYLLLNSGFMRLSLVSITYGLLFIALMWRFAFEKEQRERFREKFINIINKIK